MLYFVKMPSFIAFFMNIFKSLKKSRNGTDPVQIENAVFKSYKEIVFQQSGDNHKSSINQRKKSGKRNDKNINKIPESARVSTQLSVEELVPALTRLRQDISEMRQVWEHIVHHSL